MTFKKLFLIIFIINVLSLKFAFAVDDVSTPSVYKVTMKKVELCISSDGLTCTLLGEKDGTFDIASATAGADVGDWIGAFALEVGKTYTHIKATISTTMTIAGYTTNSDISSDYCVTESSPNTASAANQGAIVDGSSTTTNAEMTYIIPNGENAENGAPYEEIDFQADGITRVNDATTFIWIGKLTSSYTPGPASSPKITIKFDVTNQLKSTQQAADACYMWAEKPQVSVSLTD